MQRRHPYPYAALKAMHQDARDAIAIKPPRMTDQEWREEFGQLADDEASQLQRLTMRMTWEFIESMEQSGPGGSV